MDRHTYLVPLSPKLPIQTFIVFQRYKPTRTEITRDLNFKFLKLGINWIMATDFTDPKKPYLPMCEAPFLQMALTMNGESPREIGTETQGDMGSIPRRRKMATTQYCPGNHGQGA